MRILKEYTKVQYAPLNKKSNKIKYIAYILFTRLNTMYKYIIVYFKILFKFHRILPDRFDPF